MKKLEKRQRRWWYHIKRILPRVWSHPRNRNFPILAVLKAVAWQIYKRLFNSPVKMELTKGVKIFCHPNSTSASNVVYFGGLHDYHEMNFVKDYLRPGDKFVDCGANIGVYTLLAASCVGPEGKGYSFEPFHGAYSKLVENLALNNFDWVETFPAGVASEKKMGRLSAKLGVANRLVDSSVDGDSVEVQLLALDDVVGDEQLSFAKVDVEGAELEVFQGAQRLLGKQSPPVWLFEMLDGQLAKQGVGREQICSILEEHGYGLFSYDSDSKVFVEAPESCSGNIFAVARDRLEEVRARLNEK